MENSKKYEGCEVLSGTRNVVDWPFSRYSIWNMPIGSDAVYEPAGLKPEPAFGIDKEIIYTTDWNDDYIEICNSRHGRWPEEDKLVHTGKFMYWPKGLIMPATNGNACCAIIQPDKKTVIQIQPTCRATYDSKYIVGWNRDAVDLYGDGLYGTHWGSGLSSIGGSLRRGELVGDEPIRHALKLNIWGNAYVYFGEDVPGYRWPADRCDSCAYNEKRTRQFYGGLNPQLTMGSLLAIKPEATLDTVPMRTEVGKKLFYALQDYGCYIVDNSAWEDYDFSAEFGVTEEVLEKYGINLSGAWGWLADSSNNAQWDYFRDITNLMRALHIVTNNAPDAIGGGGTPRVPLAPDFE